MKKLNQEICNLQFHKNRKMIKNYEIFTQIIIVIFIQKIPNFLFFHLLKNERFTFLHKWELGKIRFLPFLLRNLQFFIHTNQTSVKNCMKSSHKWKCHFFIKKFAIFHKIIKNWQNLTILLQIVKISVRTMRVLGIRI